MCIRDSHGAAQLFIGDRAAGQLQREARTRYDGIHACLHSRADGVGVVLGCLLYTSYSGLVRRTPDGSLAPELCERWEVSADRLTYTF